MEKGHHSTFVQRQRVGVILIVIGGKAYFGVPGNLCGRFLGERIIKITERNIGAEQG